MAVQTTTTLSNSIQTQYNQQYLAGVSKRRFYEQCAVDYTKITGVGKTMDEIMKGSAFQVPFLSSMTPTATTISQTADLTPQVLVDAYASMTPTSRGDAIQWSQQTKIQAYDDFVAQAHKRLGENVSETLEALLVDTALAGTWVIRAEARASLNAGTTTDLATDAKFRYLDGLFATHLVPGYIDAAGAESWGAYMHNYVHHDICESGNVDAVGLYQDKSIPLNWELGRLGRFRLVVSPFAKTFWAAGAANTTPVATTLNGAVTKMGTTIITAADHAANIAKGKSGWLVGTIEAGDTFYPANEMVVPLSATTYTVTISGSADNGGLRYSHLTGATVSNADSVYPVLIAGPQSLVKIYATDPAGDDPDARMAPGESGAAIVGPLRSGLAHQWTSLAWKFWGGYGLISQSRICRAEFATSYEAD